MKDFRRVFKYIWPQWPRLIVVVLTALIVALLLSVSFLTIIPMLKVMMGREGLHGWVDRKSCARKYGLDFYTPGTAEILDSNSSAPAYYLLVTNIKHGSLAAEAGLKKNDRIMGAGRYLSDELRRVPFTTMLEELATTKEPQIRVRIKRGPVEIGGTSQIMTLTLNTLENEKYFSSKNLKGFERFKWKVNRNLVSSMQWAAGFVPREQTQAGRTKAVIYIIIAVGFLTVIRCLAKFYQGYMAEKVVQLGLTNLRQDAFSRVMDMPLRYFAGERPTDTVSRLVRDTNVMRSAIKALLGKALREPLNASFMLAFAFLLNWQLTLIFLCAAPVVFGLMGIFGRKMKKATRKSLVASSQMLSKLKETISGLRIVKVYNQQDYERQAFKKVNFKLLKQQLKISKVDAATTPVLEVLGMVAGSAALIIGVHWVTSNRMDASEFFGLLILLGVAAESVRKTSNVWNKIQQANAAAKRVFTVLDGPVEPQKQASFEIGPLKEKIEFIDVTFAYPKAPVPVLRGVNLTVQAGYNIAIVGPNGSGKTTLANLIPRFYNPDSGCILIDGTDIRDATLFSLRKQISLVSQNVVTFNTSIAENIAYGNPRAKREQIIEAAKSSFAHDFISLLPDGYDTLIGEDGVGLSGGQLQRVVIARAILKDPSILIFDEATSQVDADSEAKIHTAIEEIMKDRTSFIIAHRFSTVIAAELIVVMDDGKIIAQGLHDELIQDCRLYQSLYETQLVRA